MKKTNQYRRDYKDVFLRGRRLWCCWTMGSFI